MTAGRGALVVAITPVVVTLGAWWLLAEHMTRPKALGSVLALLGCLTVIGNGSPLALLDGDIGVGELADPRLRAALGGLHPDRPHRHAHAVAAGGDHLRLPLTGWLMLLAVALAARAGRSRARLLAAVVGGAALSRPARHDARLHLVQPGRAEDRRRARLDLHQPRAGGGGAAGGLAARRAARAVGAPRRRCWCSPASLSPSLPQERLRHDPQRSPAHDPRHPARLRARATGALRRRVGPAIDLSGRGAAANSRRSAPGAWWCRSNGAAPASTTCRWRWRWRRSPPATARPRPSCRCRTRWSAASSIEVRQRRAEGSAGSRARPRANCSAASA